MGKLATLNPRTTGPTGPTSTVNRDYTHEGGAGYAKDVKTELFTLAVANFVSEASFYESAGNRDARFEALVAEATLEDPGWTADLIRWLRSDANMRTASLVAAAIYAHTGAPNSRQVIASACQRADEPAEILAYWLGHYGKPVPSAVKRGIADAAVRLYNERSAIKWDSSGSPMRMGDVIDLTHPKAKAGWQSELFRYLLDVRHNRDNPRLGELADLTEFLNWRREPSLATLPKLATWENTSSHFATDAAFWEAMVPQMGYMALLRNLRNIENAGVSAATTTAIETKLTTPEEVEASRQLPFRFWSAWKHSGTMRFGPALETALDLSIGNIPRFDGRTLVLVDTSGSMQSPMSGKSKIAAVEAGALFGAAVIARSEKGSRLVIYADGAAVVEPDRSVIRTTGKIVGSVGVVGHGTNTWPSAQAAWESEGPFDRVLVFTDGQDHPSRANPNVIKAPIYVWDLRGYKTANLELGSGRYLLGGLNDQSFKLINILEHGRNAGWPWDH